MGTIGWPVILLQASGSDAERYLHNRLTNNVKGLKINETQWAAALTPQGKTQALFLIKRTAKDSFDLLAEGGEVHTVKEGLLRFKVADRITVEEIPEVSAIWCGQDNNVKTEFPESVKFFPQKFGNHFGALAVGTQTQLETLRSFTVTDIKKYGYLSAAARFPRFPTEINEKYLFSESGLEAAVSYNKGCFVGQEVVHKISAFAMLPYELGVVAFEVGAAIEVGLPILAASGEVCGVILSLYYGEEKVLAFARVKSEIAKELQAVTSGNSTGQFLGICEHA